MKHLIPRFLYSKALCALTKIFVLCLTPYLAIADENKEDKVRYDGEVVVTAAEQNLLIDTPRSVSVFNRDDIEASGVRDITELLARAGNVTLNSFSGTSKVKRLDVRGSGDTSVSNVVTLLDGMRINTPDLAGADFSVVPIYLVERVELVRGPNVVRYGQGASQGAINIITKSPQESKVEFRVTGGERYNQKAVSSVGKFNEHSSIFVHSILEEDDGYRDHDTVDATSHLVGFRFDDRGMYVFNLSGRFYRDTYRLPGPLSVSGVEEGTVDPKSAGVNRLAGETDDFSIVMKNELRALRNLTLSLNGLYRERKNYFVFQPELFFPFDLIYLRSESVELGVDWSSPENRLNLIGGVSNQENYYYRTNGGVEIVNGFWGIEDSYSRGGYIHSSYTPVDGISLGLGYRRNKHQSTSFSRQFYDDLSDVTLCGGINEFTGNYFDCPQLLETRETDNRAWRNEAFELSVIGSPSSGSRAYATAAKTFRAPNVDEFNLAPSDDDELSAVGRLRPQTAERYESGFRIDSEKFSLDIACFYSRTTNEIIFRNIPGVGGERNFNFPEPIKRKGVELSGNVQINSRLAFSYSLGYVDAKISKDLVVPLVPKYTGSISLNFNPVENTTIIWSTRYTDERFDGNEFDKQELILNDYTLTDISLTQKWDYEESEITFNASLSNAFNESYIPLSYSNLGYPGPGRTFRLSLGISR